MDEKTNVMRILDQKKVKYTEYTYLNTDAVGGQEVAEVLGEDANKVFKTLVTVGKTGNHYVFLVPVNKELNLKKAAKAVGGIYSVQFCNIIFRRRRCIDGKRNTRFQKC